MACALGNLAQLAQLGCFSKTNKELVGISDHQECHICLSRGYITISLIKKSLLQQQRLHQNPPRNQEIDKTAQSLGTVHVRHGFLVSSTLEEGEASGCLTTAEVTADKCDRRVWYWKTIKIKSKDSKSIGPGHARCLWLGSFLFYLVPISIGILPVILYWNYSYQIHISTW